MDKEVTPTLRWSLDCECPHCDEDIDLSNIGHIFPDHEAEITECIFNNKWDKLEGFEIICPICEKEFAIKEIEY